MGAIRKICRAILLTVVCLSGAERMPGDTIVLKNGRRILALSVTQTGDKVTYETASGTLTLPSAIVDHVERGGVPSAEGAASASTLSLKSPDGEATTALLSPNQNEIELRVIQNGELDRNYVAQLENEARSGLGLANQNAAMAHHAASQFELLHGDMDLALADARTALNYAPQHPVLLMDVAYLYLRRSEYRQSLEYLERAGAWRGRSEVSKLAGWAYFGLNKLDQAVAEWKHAESLRPDAEVEAALKKAERDKRKRSSTRKMRAATSHCVTAELRARSGAGCVHALERHFAAIESELAIRRRIPSV
jgi:tetratricopeptide (TPR) repeat protein